MSEQNGKTATFALLVVAAVLSLVLAGVIGLAVWKGTRPAPVERATAPAIAALAGEPKARIYFSVGSDALPAADRDALVDLADALRQNERTVLISGYHDTSGDAASNADLAKRRAQAVRHALEANGVAPDRLVLDRPAVVQGGAEREARRVEIRLR